MRFQVPQFIEVEDRIFGPLTLKQFIYVAGGAGLSFVIYILANNLIISLIPIVVVMAASLSLSFYPKSTFGKPLIDVVEAAFRYYTGGKLFIWKKEDKPAPQTTAAAAKDVKNFASIMVPKISDSKLKDLTWSLDIKESIYSNKKQR
ncbi:MAG: PrgI family protein [Patescibacteria group bacterium]|nr:PrgI family protein [Patescibacteria group bacterium]